MNKYGLFAMKAWQELAPSEYAQIEDPNQHFSQLGEQAEQQIAELAYQLAGDDQPDETFWAKVGRLGNATSRAEEMVRADLLTPPPNPDTGEWETVEDPDDDWVSPFEEMTQMSREWKETISNPTTLVTDPSNQTPPPQLP